MQKSKYKAQEIALSDINSTIFYQAIEILGIELTSLSIFVGKSKGYYSERKFKNNFSRKDIYNLKQYCEETYSKTAFEETIQEAMLQQKYQNLGRNALLNQIELLKLEVHRLEKVNNELNKEILELE